MNKPTRLLSYILLNAFLYTALYYGVQGNVAAARVYCFFVWLDFATYFILNAGVGENAAKLKAIGRSINPHLDSLIDLLALGVLVYFGWYITAFAVFFATEMKTCFYDDFVNEK